MHADLLDLPYFEGISTQGLLSLVDSMTPAQFEEGDLIMTEGSGDSPLFIATHGRVVVCKSSREGVDRNLAELDAPTLFGEIELFCQIPAVCSARALSRVSAFKLDRPTLDQLFASRDPGVTQFVFNVARVACHRLAIADEMLAHYLDVDDLVELRQSVFTQMPGSDRFDRTGVFKRPG